jgi:hypothetical protein
MKNKITKKPVVFAAMSKDHFYWREHIIKYILEQECTPLSAFMMFSYFLLDTVDRVALIESNNDLIRLADQLWVFGNLSEGVKAEIGLAKQIGMPIRYFRIDEVKGPIDSNYVDEATISERIHETKENECGKV